MQKDRTEHLEPERTTATTANMILLDEIDALEKVSVKPHATPRLCDLLSKDVDLLYV